MDKDTLQKLEQAFSIGATDVQACFYAGISKATLYNYQEKHPEFVDRKEALKSNLAYIAKGVLAQSLREGKVDEAKWYLERKEKDEFSTKVTNTNQHEGGIEITVTKKVHSARDTDPV